MSNVENNVKKMVILVPFSGFYESVHGAVMDTAEEMDAEHFASKDNDSYPEAVGMDESDIATILYQMADYKKGHLHYAESYVKAFVGYVKQETGVDLGLEFESLDSPREYNFTTDRIFAQIPVSILEELRAKVTLGNFAEVIKERHESRSGFCSFYTTDIEEWSKKPVTEYDHNELETLLITWMRQEMTKDADEAINDHAIEFDSEMALHAWQECVEWSDFEAKCKEFKEKDAEK